MTCTLTDCVAVVHVVLQGLMVCHVLHRVDPGPLSIMLQLMQGICLSQLPAVVTLLSTLRLLASLIKRAIPCPFCSAKRGLFDTMALAPSASQPQARFSDTTTSATEIATASSFASAVPWLHQHHHLSQQHTNASDSESVTVSDWMQLGNAALELPDMGPDLTHTDC